MAGLWLGPFLSFFPITFLVGLLGVGCFLTWVEYHHTLSRLAGLLLFSLLVSGILYAHWASLSRDSSFPLFTPEPPLAFQGEIVAPVRRTPDGLIMIVDARSVDGHGQITSPKIRIRVNWRKAQGGLVYGDVIAFTSRIRKPHGTRNPGGFDYAAYLKQSGVHALATVYGLEGVRKIEGTEPSGAKRLLGLVGEWRQRIHQTAESSLTNPALGLFLGMILGEQSYISQEIRDAFMTSGTVHILSISGSHLGLLALVIFLVIRWGMRICPASWIERLSVHLTLTHVAIIFTLPAISFYALLAGGEIATIRSWLMIVVGCWGLWLGRGRNILTALAVAALITLLPNPDTIHHISFQLSYLSVMAIGLVVLTNQWDDSNLSHSPSETRSKAQKWVAIFLMKSKGAWLITLAVTFMTLPLVAYYFHQIPWLGLLANMIIVPLVGILVIPIGLLAGAMTLLSRVEVLPFAAYIQGIYDWLAYMVLMIAQIPGGDWHVSSPSVLAMLMFWGLLIGLLMLRGRPLVQCGCAVGLIAILGWWAWSPRSDWESGRLRVSFLDVGQGDATVLELPDGQTVLIDGGPAYSRWDMGRMVIGPYLWDRGIRYIDHIVATHPQWDHVGGLPWVLQAFEVGEYWSNGVPRNRVFYERLKAALQTAELEEQIIRAEHDIVGSGPCLLSVLGPFMEDLPIGLASTHEITGTELNNRSLITRLDCGPHSFLFTADAEQKALEQLQKTQAGYKAKIVKVPHHGARSSLHQGWVDQVTAQAMVVSVGSYNRYGHPASEVVAAYAKRGLPLYRTDRDGAIIMEASLDSPELSIRSTRGQELIPVPLNSQTWKHEWENWEKML